MPCPECEARSEGMPNSKWSGGDYIPPYPDKRPRPANHPPEENTWDDWDEDESDELYYGRNI